MNRVAYKIMREKTRGERARCRTDVQVQSLFFFVVGFGLREPTYA